eukprot:GFYU01024563.1.p1 GENE.GFYU01024563.1~~GFYU01024563.1.p1  ORF type:complete len:683 (+),score=129.02 GFYU01024563.1:103-2151(+)
MKTPTTVRRPHSGHAAGGSPRVDPDSKSVDHGAPSRVSSNVKKGMFLVLMITVWWFVASSGLLSTSTSIGSGSVTLRRPLGARKGHKDSLKEREQRATRFIGNAKEVGEGLCIFALPKAMIEPFKSRQMRALSSWAMLREHFPTTIVLIGDAEGIAEAAREYGAIHVNEKVKVDQNNIPMLEDVWNKGERQCKSDIVMYVNADIYIEPDELKHVVITASELPLPFVITGVRYNIPEDRFGLIDWKSYGQRFQDDAQDYFIFRKGTIRFPTGLTMFYSFDSYLTLYGSNNFAYSVDASDFIHAYHFNHPYVATSSEHLSHDMAAPERVANRDRVKQYFYPGKDPTTYELNSSVKIMSVYVDRNGEMQYRLPHPPGWPPLFGRASVPERISGTYNSVSAAWVPDDGPRVEPWMYEYEDSTSNVKEDVCIFTMPERMTPPFAEPQYIAIASLAQLRQYIPAKIILVGNAEGVGTVAREFGLYHFNKQVSVDEDGLPLMQDLFHDGEFLCEAKLMMYIKPDVSVKAYRLQHVIGLLHKMEKPFLVTGARHTVKGATFGVGMWEDKAVPVAGSSTKAADYFIYLRGTISFPAGMHMFYTWNQYIVGFAYKVFGPDRTIDATPYLVPYHFDHPFEPTWARGLSHDLHNWQRATNHNKAVESLEPSPLNVDIDKLGTKVTPEGLLAKLW